MDCSFAVTAQTIQIAIIKTMTYPEDFINKVIQGDCLEVMKQMPDKCVDLVLTDPPYGDGIGYGRMAKEIENNEDESINYKVLPDLYRLLKEGGGCYLFTNWKFSGKIMRFVEEQTSFNIRMQLVVVKNNIGMGYGFRNQYELCLVLEKGEVKYENGISNVLKMEHINHDKDSHPHEKGLELLKTLISHSSKTGDVVLDCFLGSGSTAVACKQLNRKYIGIELSEKYCQIARDRLAQDLLF